MSRLQTRFAELKQQNRAALVTFVTAGDPGYETSLAILKGLPAAKHYIMIGVVAIATSLQFIESKVMHPFGTAMSASIFAQSCCIV
mgnify:CR=1 FL=1